MANTIPPSSLPVSAGISRPRDTAASGEKDNNLRKHASPAKAHKNYIPSPDVLRSLIERALDALSHGVYWQRGSIINLVL